MEISITLIIIIATSIISFIAFSNHNLMEQFIFYPPAVRRGQVYRFFSCGLIHADWGHLISIIKTIIIIAALALRVLCRLLYLPVYFFSLWLSLVFSLFPSMLQVLS